MMNSVAKFYKMIFATSFLLVILLSFATSSEVKAATCPSGCYWHPTLQICTGFYGCVKKGVGECDKYHLNKVQGYCCDPCTTSCTSGCNACASYAYLQATFTNYGTKVVSCKDDCGDTDWDTCYCTSQCTLASCPSQYSTTSQGFGSLTYDDCTNECGQSRIRTCYCNACSLSSCPTGTSTSGSYGYKTTKSCTNDCGIANAKDCYCTSQCTLASCPSQYSTTNLGSGSLVYDTCTNECGQKRTQTCYCKSCTPNPCPSKYSNTNQGYGSLIYDTCTNECGKSNASTCYCSQCSISCPSGTSTSIQGDLYLPKPTCTNDCGITETLDCYYSCKSATCANLESKVDWTDTVCSESTKGCRIARDKVIPINDSDPGCPSQETKICYIQNIRPESPDKDNEGNNLDVHINLEVVLGVNSYRYHENILEKFIKKIKAENLSNVLGYESDTHSGTQLNNPLKVTVQFSDENGVEDLEALYMWWSTSSTKDFTTPNRIANPTEGLIGKTEDNENFGFMITRNESGKWANIYRPHIDGNTKAWVQEETSSPTSITILGSNGKSMVDMSSISITETDSNTVAMEANMLFMWEGIHEKVENAQYNIWTLANDTVGFLPFEEFENIGDSEDKYWKDSGTDWIVDLNKPFKVNKLNSSNLEEQKISMRFAIEDAESNLSRVRLDACRSGGDESKPNDLLVEEGEDTRAYSLKYCNDVDWDTLNMEKGNNLLGVNPLNPNTSTYSIDGVNDTLVINLNDNSNGSITFRLTFMDEAGNWAQDVYTHSLGEWVAVKDAFVFGRNGVSSSTRELETEWINNPISAYGFEESTIDLTDQVLIGGKDSVSGFIGVLKRSTENQSFIVSQFGGVFISSPYSELIAAYKDRMKRIGETLDYQEVELDSSDLSGGILSLCTEDPEICILHSKSESINISSGSVCNGKGLLIASGDITIDPDFTDSSDSSGCIIIANGNITIGNGQNKISTSVEYDIVEAFLIAGGEIIIESDSSGNGLMVEGGLVGFTPVSARSAVNNQRSINLKFRNIHPVLAVKGNAKYGLFSKKLFGSQTNIFQVYIGFKPY